MPLLLLVIAGVVDFGRALYTQVILTNAAREGVRAAVMGTPSPGDIETRARVGAIGLQTASPTLNVLPTTCPTSGGNATVQLSYAFDWLILEPALRLVGGGDLLPQTLNAKAVMKCGG
jgi:Flp pilus assembly protein TadG